MKRKKESRKDTGSQLVILTAILGLVKVALEILLQLLRLLQD